MPLCPDSRLEVMFIFEVRTPAFVTDRKPACPVNPWPAVTVSQEDAIGRRSPSRAGDIRNELGCRQRVAPSRHGRDRALAAARDRSVLRRRPGYSVREI